MRLTILWLLFAVHMAAASVPGWEERSGTFAVFQTPASLKFNPGKVGGDTSMEAFESRDISLTFDSEVRMLPPTFRKELERTIDVWVAQRRSDWAKFTHVDNGGTIHGLKEGKDPEGRPFYLYFGFAVEEEWTFAIHIRFRNLDNLGDIERILKSIRLKVSKDYRPIKPPRDPRIIPGLDPIPETK